MSKTAHQLVDRTEPSDEDSFVIGQKPFSSFCDGISRSGDISRLKKIEGEFIVVNTIYKKMGEVLADQSDAVESINSSVISTRKNAKKGKEELKKALDNQQKGVPFELKALILVLVIILMTSLPILL
jgi:t-SNARE complex subunit (syntaxin)